MFAVFMLVAPRQWWLYALCTLPTHLAVQIRHGTAPAAIAMLFVTNLNDGALRALAV